MDNKYLSTRLTNDIWTAPQKHVAVASSSVDQPSLAMPDSGKNDFDVSGLDAIFVWFSVTVG